MTDKQKSLWMEVHEVAETLGVKSTSIAATALLKKWKTRTHPERKNWKLYSREDVMHYIANRNVGKSSALRGTTKSKKAPKTPVVSMELDTELAPRGGITTPGKVMLLYGTHAQIAEVMRSL